MRNMGRGGLFGLIAASVAIACIAVMPAHAQGADNAVIDELLQRLNVPIHRLLFDSFYDVERLRTANDDHRRILRAILARDAAAAEEAMRAHVQAGFEMLSAIETEYQI